MLPNIVINLYYHSCGKIVTSNVKPLPLKEAEDKIKKWLENPICIDCLFKKWNLTK